MSDEYYIEYSVAKDGWCVFKHKPDRGSLARGIKEAGPYREKAEAEKERDRLNA